MTVALIVREQIDVTEELNKRLESIITKLIVNEWASEFLFTDIGEFELSCYDVVSKLKKVFPNIVRKYVSGDCDHDQYRKGYITELYDEFFWADSNERASYELRDRTMVEMCDVLLTYYNLRCEINAKWTSCTATTVAYAWKKKKRILNVFEYR